MTACATVRGGNTGHGIFVRKYGGNFNELVVTVNPGGEL